MQMDSSAGSSYTYIGGFSAVVLVTSGFSVVVLMMSGFFSGSMGTFASDWSMSESAWWAWATEMLGILL